MLFRRTPVCWSCESTPMKFCRIQELTTTPYHLPRPLTRQCDKEKNRKRNEIAFSKFKSHRLQTPETHKRTQRKALLSITTHPGHPKNHHQLILGRPLRVAQEKERVLGTRVSKCRVLMYKRLKNERTRGDGIPIRPRPGERGPVLDPRTVASASRGPAEKTDQDPDGAENLTPTPET